ncbi:MAG: CotH kinase family protein, partial [Clostridia bacterium]|nr:CotH kinase family protein [Clostridia bacterium]
SAFMREPLGFKMFEDACQGAYFSSDYTFVQVYINYDYYGAYVLCEQTQIQENRINIDEKKDEDTKLRTGYLVEIDNYWQNEDYTFIMDYDNVWLTDMYGVTKQARQAGYSVKYDVMTWDQLNYISKYIHNVYKIVYQAIYENRYYKLNGNNDLVLAQNEFSSAEACVGNVLDLEAAAAMYISREVAAERDGGIGSFFMYVDFTADHPRLTFCAPWDYSWAYGTSEGFAMEHFWVSAFQPEEFAYAGNRSFTWFITLYKSSFFKNIVKRQWREMNTRGDQQGWLDELDRVATVYADDFAMNTRRWNSGDQATASGYIREFVRQRIQWLNSQWL